MGYINYKIIYIYTRRIADPITTFPNTHYHGNMQICSCDLYIVTSLPIHSHTTVWYTINSE